MAAQNCRRRKIDQVEELKNALEQSRKVTNMMMSQGSEYKVPSLHNLLKKKNTEAYFKKRNTREANWLKKKI